MKRSELDELLLAPSETLGVELKQWIDPREPEQRAKIARTLIALRNNNGGQLIFGFDDKSRQPCPSRPADLEKMYHPDDLQGIVKEFIEPPFDITLHNAQREGATFPVIEVPGGITVPAFARKDGAKLRRGAVYVRSIQSGRVSSAEPQSPQDWDSLLGICFDNREADIGRFFRRHLAGIREEISRPPQVSPPQSGVITPDTSSSPAGPATAHKVIDQVFAEGVAAFEELLRRVESDRSRPDIEELKSRKAWRETAAAIDGELKSVQSPTLLETLFPAHPRLSGWPIWVDSRGFREKSDHPFPIRDGWQTLVGLDTPDFVVAPKYDFWRLQTNGHFYHRRTHDEDTWTKVSEQDRRTFIDFPVAVSRVAEAVGTAAAFARRLAVAPDDSYLMISVRWNELHGRRMISWTEPGRDLFADGKAYEDTARGETRIPLSLTLPAMAKHVNDLVQPLFAVFGANLSASVVEDIAMKVLQRGPM